MYLPTAKSSTCPIFTYVGFSYGVDNMKGFTPFLTLEVTPLHGHPFHVGDRGWSFGRTSSPCPSPLLPWYGAALAYGLLLPSDSFPYPGSWIDATEDASKPPPKSPFSMWGPNFGLQSSYLSDIKRTKYGYLPTSHSFVFHLWNKTVVSLPSFRRFSV